MGDRDPESFARRRQASLPSPTQTHQASNVSVWYGGKFPDPLPNTDPATSIVYRSNRVFGPITGEVTPGRANMATSLPLAQFVINEVNLNPAGQGNDRYQYVEILNVTAGSPGARSLDGYWLLVVDSSTIDNNTAGLVGVIIEEWDLSAMATGTNGLLLLGNDFTSSHTPFQDTVPPETSLGDPVARTSAPLSSAWAEGNLEAKDGFTLLLVRGYTPPTNKDMDTNDDGDWSETIKPWTLVDSVGFSQALAVTAGRTYASVDLTKAVDAANGLPAPVVPDAFSRKAGTTAMNAASWYGGTFSGESGAVIGYAGPTPTSARSWFGGFRGAATPGRPNLSTAMNPATPLIPGELRLNEVMIDPTNFVGGELDRSNEYIELVSTTGAQLMGDGYWVLIVNMQASQSGQIADGFWLDGYSTGVNGMAVIGDSIDDIDPYRATAPMPPTAATIDPEAGIGGSDIPNNGMAILLVRGPLYDATGNPNGPFLGSAQVTINSLRATGDLDPDNDGVLLPPAQWLAAGAVLVDSIVVSPVNPGAAYSWISSAPQIPHHVTRTTGNLTANSAAAWNWGQINQPSSDAPDPFWAGAFFSGPFRSGGSPGRPNYTAVPGNTAPGTVVLNELHFNPAGADGNAEFIEILDTTGAARSLNGYDIVMLDNTVRNTGGVRRVWSLDGFATGPGGICMVSNLSPNPSPFASVIRPTTTVVDPPGRNQLVSGFGDATIGTETDNQNVTFLLVRSFGRYIGFDLDITPAQSIGGGPLDLDGDGIFDVYPWLDNVNGIHDSVVLRSYVPIIPAPVAPAGYYPYDGWSYSTQAMADLTGTWFPNPATLFYHPETVARFLGENSRNSAASWYGGDLRGGTTGNDALDTSYVTNDPTHPPLPAGFTGRVTPGQPNVPRNASADPDGDGQSSLLEVALGSNPLLVSDGAALPSSTTVNVSGQNYGAFTYRRIRNGTTAPSGVYTAEAYTYTVETSADLQTWTPNAAPGAPASLLVAVGAPAANPDGVTENVTVRLPTAATPGAATVFFRLKIGRF